MKSIMISIKPKWCAKIMNGEKTIEVRKNKTLANAIEKLVSENGYADIYVYCSKGKYEMGKFNSDKKYHEIRDDCSYAGGWLRGLPDETVNGKVVFKFRCYKVEEIKVDFSISKNGYYGTYLLGEPVLEKTSCLTHKDLKEYLKGDEKCNDIQNIGYAIHISNLEIFDRPKELSEFHLVKDKLGVKLMGLTKAPQNFCYVEV